MEKLNVVCSLSFLIITLFYNYYNVSYEESMSETYDLTFIKLTNLLLDIEVYIKSL